MKLSSILVIHMLLLLIAMSIPASAQWQRVESLAGMYVWDFEVSSRGLLCALPQRDDGFYVSTTNGDSWIHRHESDMPRSLGPMSVSPGIEVSDNDLFILSYDKLYRVRDFSQGLELLPPPRDGKVGTFACTPDGKLYVTLVDNPLTDSVYVSTDFGVTWTGVCAKYSHARKDNALYIDREGHIWSHNMWSIARYDEQSASWIRIEGIGFEESDRQRLFPQVNGDVYVNCGDRIAKYSQATDSLSTLYTSNATITPRLEFWHSREGYLLVSDRGIDEDDWILLRSTDDGATWLPVRSGLPNVYSFLGESTGTVFAAYGSEIVRSVDHGRSFRDCTEGIYSTNINHFETRGNRVHVMAWWYAMSDDGGGSWNYPGYGGSGINPHECQVTTDGTIYEHRGWIRISRDSTKTWEYPGLGFLTDLLALDDVVLAATRDGVIFRSIDEGRNWEVVRIEEGHMFELTEHSGVLFAVKKGRLLLSFDRGVTWEKKPFPTSVETDAVTLGINDRVLLLAGMGFLWSSSDLGDSWTEISIAPLNGRFRKLASNRDGTFAAVYLKNFSGTEISQIAMLSTDDGVTWSSISAGLPRPFAYPSVAWVSDIGFTSATRILINVEGRGLYAYDDVPVAVHSVRRGPSTLQMSLWPTVTSEFLQLKIESVGEVRITVFNALGMLMNAYFIDSDVQRHSIDVTSWIPGTYFLHASSKNGSVLKPFVVVR